MINQTTQKLLLAATMLVSAPATSRAQSSPADLVVYGRIWTGDPVRPWADALAVSGDRIVQLGTRRQMLGRIGRTTRIIDAGRNLVTPGFGDAHTHFLDGGFQLTSVDLRDADSPAEFIRRIAAFARTVPEEGWITGGDWDHERWPGATLPRHEWIDSVTRGRAVFVQRLDGHMGVANAYALRLAGITRDTPNPPGGLIVKDSITGEPTGVLKDNAMDRIFAVIPPPTQAQSDSALARAMRHAVAHGVTQVHVMADWDAFAVFRRARLRNSLLTRVRAYVQIGGWRRLADTVRAAGRGDAWFNWGGLKGFMDGSLGSTTAAFYEPYLDAPSTRGFLVTDSATRLQEIISADSAGLQVAVHAIGDRANAMLLGFYEQAIRQNGTRDRRFRIEHAQHLRQQDIPRFAALGVIPSMQPYHVIDDGRWAAHRLDTARLRGTYAFASLIRARARMAFGSDWTVAPLDPILGIYAAVTRRTLDGLNPGGWFPEQKITLEDALRAYTYGVAYAGFMDDRTGILRTGMLADLVVLDRDLFQVRPEQIADARVMVTVVGGRVMYERIEGAGPNR